MRIYYSLLLLVLAASCNGQVKTSLPKKSLGKPGTIPPEQAKMIKSQGSYSYHTHTGPWTDTNVCISAILEDKSGNIWAATMGEGVYRYDGKSFTNFTTKDGLLTNVVYSMMEDREGNIWFGTTNGASRYNKKSFTNFPFSVIKGNSTSLLGVNTSKPPVEAPGPFTEVWSMLQDNSGKIWFGTTDGVYRYDGRIFTNILDLDTIMGRPLPICFQAL